MHLQKPITQLLNQLEDSISQLTDDQYCTPVSVLSNTSIGQHVRHVIEFFSELLKGYDGGLVNYDQRQRDHRIETNRTITIQLLQETTSQLVRADKPLRLSAAFPVHGIAAMEFNTNYQRELLYNLEHTVHHMALIRIGIEAVSVTRLPVEFGVAESTIQFRHACAQ